MRGFDWGIVVVLLTIILLIVFSLGFLTLEGIASIKEQKLYLQEAEASVNNAMEVVIQHGYLKDSVKNKLIKELSREGKEIIVTGTQESDKDDDGYVFMSVEIRRIAVKGGTVREYFTIKENINN